MPKPYHGWPACACVCVALLLTVAPGCRKSSGEAKSSEQSEDQGAARADDGQAPKRECRREPFAESVELAEASGAVVVPGVGLVVVADSGHRGAYAVLDPKAGEAIEMGVLPLDEVLDDDLEGVAFDRSSGRLVTLTSGGTVSEFTREGDHFRRKHKAYSVGPNPGCSPRATNCGENWEGLCLGKIAVPSLAGCVGLAVSKHSGELVCLERDDADRLHLEGDRRLEVARADVAAGCDIDENGSVWLARNLVGANLITEISAAESRNFATYAAGSIEAIAVVETDTNIEIVLASDLNTTPSALFRYLCGPGL